MLHTGRQPIIILDSRMLSKGAIREVRFPQMKKNTNLMSLFPGSAMFDRALVCRGDTEVIIFPGLIPLSYI
jgi:hypothetical protein